MRARTLTWMASLGGSVLLGTTPADAAFTEVVATSQDVDLTGVGFGLATVWRLYAAFDNTNDKLTSVIGVSSSPVTISTDNGSGFFQSPAGGDDSSEQSPPLLPVIPGLAQDSFLDIGATLSNQAPEVTFGPGFPPEGWGTPAQGNALSTTTGFWFQPQTEPITTAGADGRVFFAQITIARGRRLNFTGNLTTVEDGATNLQSGVTFNSIPTPGVLSFVGLAGLAGTRRRRRA